MTKQTKKFILLALAILCSSLITKAQEKKNAQSLIAIIDTLEKRYGYQFNYAQDVLEDIKLVEPSTELPFTHILDYLRKATGLEYTLLNNNLVLISENENISGGQVLNALPEVIVPSYIINGIYKLNNGGLKIDFSDFRMLPGLIEADVLQSIKTFPGIQSVNENVSNISIRGGSHDQNLILWDGIKMYQSGHFFGLISMYNPQITQNVLLLKNGTDVSMTDGVSGTISMQTEQALNKEFKGNFGVNFIDANGFFDIPVGKKSSVQIALRKSISDIVETPAYTNFFNKISEDTEVENTMNTVMNTDKKFDFYDASFRWIYNVNDRDKLQVNFINVSNQLIFNENTADQSRQSSVTQNSIAGAVKFTRDWNENWKSLVEVYETDYKLKAINVNILDSQRFLQENIVSETSFKLHTHYKINNTVNIVGGYHFVETEVTNLDDVDTPVFRFLVSEVLRTHGLFSQVQYWSPNKCTNITSGVRYNYISKFNKSILEPRLSVVHKLSNNLNVELLGEMKNQNTSQVINFQNDFLGIEKRRWQLSNNNTIPVIRSQQISGGINYSRNGWQIGADFYIKEVDGITTQSQGFQNQYEFVKSNGSYTAKGVDLILRKQLKRLNTWLSYAYLKNNYAFKTLPEIEFRSNYDITHAITLGSVYNNKIFKLSGGLNWFSGKPVTLPVAGNEVVDNQVNFQPSNSSELVDYLRLDFSASYNFTIGIRTKANIGVSIWNIFNTKNQINRLFGVRDGLLTETLQTSLGTNPNMIFRIYF